MAKKEIKKHAGGRPSLKRDPETISKLLNAFSTGLDDRLACYSVGIGYSTFWRWQDEDPKFKEEIERAKAQPAIMARATMINAIKAGKYMAASWWLEHTERETFGILPAQINNTLNLSLSVPPDKWEGITNAVNAAVEKLALSTGSDETTD